MFEQLKFFLARAAVVGASFATSATLLVAVAAAFDSASSEPWLRESPQARAVAERCGDYADRTARHQCVRMAVMEAQARDRGAAQLAAAGSAAAR